MPECNQCKWFKEVTPQNARVAVLRLLVQSTHGEVEQEMNRIEGDEFGKSQSEEQEIVLKAARSAYLMQQIGGNFHTFEVPAETTDAELTRTVAGFPVRFEGEPKCVTHCAEQAGAHRWFIPSLRNWAGMCPSFTPTTRKADCTACRHYCPATGDADDYRELVSITNALNETDSDAAQLLLSRKGIVEGKIGPQKAVELTMAHNSDGKIAHRLKYVPFCPERSAIPQLCIVSMIAGRLTRRQRPNQPEGLPAWRAPNRLWAPPYLRCQVACRLHLRRTADLPGALETTFRWERSHLCRQPSPRVLQRSHPWASVHSHQQPQVPL